MLHRLLVGTKTADAPSDRLLSDLTVYQFLEPARFLGMLNGHAHDIPVLVYVHVEILADLSRFSYGVIRKVDKGRVRVVKIPNSHACCVFVGAFPLYADLVR